MPILLQPKYKLDKGNSTDGTAYAKLFADLQHKSPALTPYSGITWNMSPYAILPPPLVHETMLLSDGAPGYPAHTWPLNNGLQTPMQADDGGQAAGGKPLQPYIRNIFGFGTLKNKVIGKSEYFFK